MTTDEKPAGAELERLNENIARIEELSQRLVAAMANKRQVDPHLQGPSTEVFMKAATASNTDANALATIAIRAKQSFKISAEALALSRSSSNACSTAGGLAAPSQMFFSKSSRS